LPTQVANLFVFAISGWKLVGNFVASLIVFYIPLVQQVANLHVVIDLSGGNPKKLRTSCELVGN